MADHPSVPLSMLQSKDVPYEWHDAVALASELVAQVRSGAVATHDRIPDLRGLTLEETGTLALSRALDHSMPAMPGAAQVLQQLLSGKDQPAQLRLFAMQVATAEPPVALDLFAEELSKWERPGRTAKLAALYLRAFEQIGPAALTEEAKAREERALLATRQAGDPAAAAARSKKAKLKRSGDSDGPIAKGLVLVVAAAAVGAAVWYYMGRPDTGTAPSPPPATQGADTTLPSGGRAARPAPPEPPPPPEPAPPARPPAGPRPSPAVASAEIEFARARALFEAQQYEAASAGFDRVLQLLGAETSLQAQELRQETVSLAEVARAAVSAAVAEANREYRNGDDGVIAPIALSLLPRKPNPDTPADRLQVLEVHVNTDGNVDAARFVMKRPSFRNSWWTSAAKAWRFQPATKDGQPVRFVMRIVMDDQAAQD